MNRSLFYLVCLVCLGSCAKPQYPALEENTQAHREATLAPFYHGVASGDPYPESVILWTRVTPETQLPSIEVEWEVAIDETFRQLVQSGKVSTGPERDYTVKVEAKDLKAGRPYFYRFKALGGVSLIGKTMTAAKDTDQLKFAVVSCSNYEWGYFNTYGRVAEEEDLSAVLHLGDYIYEYEIGRYGDTAIGRINIPPHEIISLQDYRDRYALYRLDPDLRAAHAKHPFIAIWDDHEITNNSYKDGAENHQAEEGDYMTRKEIARQVYYEWMPIREDQEHYRKFSFGELADLIMLDERLAGRTQQADSLSDPRLKEGEMSMLGETQLTWFTDQLKDSNGRWKLIGNQVIFSYLNWGYDGFSINLDAWDGYPREQQQIVDLIKEHNIENIIFLTGDTHSSWAFELTNKPFEEYDPATGAGAIGVEFGVTSINSSNSDERYESDFVKEHEKKIVNSPINPHLKYANMRDHGYLLLTVNKDQARADYKFVPTVRERMRGLRIERSFEVKTGLPKLGEIQ